MVKHAKRKRKNFELTWLLGPEGPSDEETSTNSCSDAFFLEEVEGFVMGLDLVLVSIPWTG
jgi:hypothetical protein